MRAHGNSPLPFGFIFQARAQAPFARLDGYHIHLSRQPFTLNKFPLRKQHPSIPSLKIHPKLPTPHSVYNCGVRPVPSKLALILLFALTSTTFISAQHAMLSTLNAIISSIALTYRGSSPALKK